MAPERSRPIAVPWRGPAQQHSLGVWHNNHPSLAFFTVTLSTTVFWLQTPGGGTPRNVNVIYTSLKSTFSAQQFRHWQCGPINIRLAVVASQKSQVAQNSEKIWTDVRFRRGRKFVVLVVGGRAASWWPLDFHLRVRRPYISRTMGRATS